MATHKDINSLLSSLEYPHLMMQAITAPYSLNRKVNNYYSTRRKGTSRTWTRKAATKTQNNAILKWQSSNFLNVVEKKEMN